MPQLYTLRVSNVLKPRAGKIDGVAKSPPYCVAALFQDFDILYVCLRFFALLFMPLWVRLVSQLFALPS